MNSNPRELSSHHFVTASQSAAVLICGPEIDGEILGQLLEWNPLVICLDRELERLHTIDTHVDIVIRTSESGLPGLPYKTEAWMPEALAAGLKRVFDDGRADNLAVVGCDPAQLNGLIGDPAFRMDVPTVFYNRNCRSVIVPAGREFRKWLPAGHRFRIDPMEHVRVLGDCIREGDYLVAESDGWIILKAEGELKFQEFL